jgi:DivIVA domain-containing protein
MAVVAVVLLGIVLLTGFAVVLALTESPISVEPVDRIDAGLPEHPITSEDIGGLRFRIGLRGYRMDDVDAALDRIRRDLAEAESDSSEPGS